MATIRELKRRITSVQSTAKITNALQLVAASKMRRAQDRALQSRPYAEKLQAVLSALAGTADQSTTLEDGGHPFLVQRPIENVAILHITPDRGLCGALNSNLNRSADVFLQETEDPLSVVSVGKKGRDFFVRARANVSAEFTDLGDYPSLAQTLAISQMMMDDYLAGTIDQVFMSYARFVSTVNQEPVVRQILPVTPPEAMNEPDSAKMRQEYLFEPSPSAVFERLLPRYIEMQIFAAILESSASEQSARMVAMKNATDNASDMVSELTLTYNKVRQEQITGELLDIVGGAAAVGG